MAAAARFAGPRTPIRDRLPRRIDLFSDDALPLYFIA